MPEIPDPSQFGAPGPAAINACLAYAASQQTWVAQLKQSYWINETVIVPPGVTLYCNGHHLYKYDDCDMVSLGERSRIIDVHLAGNASAGHSGRGFVITSGNWQRIVASVTDMDGYGCEFTTPDVGMCAQIVGTYTWQRHDATKPVIKLPGAPPYDQPGVNRDHGTSGLRRIEKIECGGGALVDVSGSNATTVDDCVTTGILIPPGASYLRLSRNRIALGAPLEVNGSGHLIDMNLISAGITIMPGAVFCKTSRMNQLSGAYADNSGNNSNEYI